MGSQRPGEPPEPVFTTGPLRWRAPVGRHRHTGWLRAGAVLAAVATAVVVLVVGGAVTGSALDADQRFREFVNTGSMGEPVPARTFEVTALAVDTAAELTYSGGQTYDTDGVWVLVRLRAMANEDSMWIRYAAVRDSQGRTWWATERIQQFLIGSHRLDPGIPVEAEVAFEVPPDAATDLTVRLSDSGTGPDDLRMQTVAEIGLPVDEAMVTRGLARPEPYQLQLVPEVVIADPQVLVGAR